MRLRSLNDRGLERLRTFLEGLKAGDGVGELQDLVYSGTYTSEVTPQADVRPERLSNRAVAARVVAEVHEASSRKHEGDEGVWAWLSLFYFDELCPEGPGGRRSPGELARWIPDAGAFRYYRHLLAGPYRILMAHRESPDQAQIVLCQPVNKPGDVVEQIASRQERVAIPTVMAVATRLYYDPVRRKVKTGAANRAGRGGRGGELERFLTFLGQLEMTRDLYSMSQTELIELLPEEFERFLNDAD